MPVAIKTVTPDVAKALAFISNIWHLQLRGG
jgi:hypothetical protein